MAYAVWLGWTRGNRARGGVEQADVVVVGAGPGGAAAAARLSDDPRLRVLLIEAGGAPGWRAAAPGYRPPPLHPLDWTRASVPQRGLGGRRVYLPAGRGLGGGSAIGWGVYARGEAEDFDRWAAAGLTGWGWDAVLPWYRRGERYRPAGGVLHGGRGPLPVMAAAPSAATCAFLAAAQASGEPLAADLAAPDARGAAPFALMLCGAERCDAVRAWLAPPGERRNLQVLTGAVAERVLFEQGRAWGVRYRRGGEDRVVRAGAVVLAAGAIATPALLMRSGVGPARQLIEHGIALVASSPRVGEGLVEGLSLALPFDAPGFGLRPRDGMAARLAWTWRRRGSLALAPVTAGVLLRAGATGGGLAAAILFTPWPEADGGRRAIGGRGFTLRVTVPQPFARGRVRLGGIGALDPPLVDPHLLGDPRDGATLRWAHEAAMRIAAAGPLAGARARLAEDDLDALFRARVEGLHQPAGTAAMGAEPEAVCDARLRVRGVEGLWMADLSALPAASLGGVATAAMVGERCAAFVRER